MPNPNKRHGRNVSIDEEAIIDLLDSKGLNYVAKFNNGKEHYFFSYNGNEYDYNVETKDFYKNKNLSGNGIAALTTELS